MTSATGRTARNRPAVQNMPGTPAAALERVAAGQQAPVVCAHCGGRELSPLGRRDHLCMGALFDWFGHFNPTGKFPMDIWAEQFITYVAHLDRC